ncbi:Lysine-specific demethylase 4 [Escovopsis weberi]|uniref:Lysine-specific demethylase 4 n=1 Tax=Escovopsis weberi TaxID=150374 RepID=A0A0N0RTC8_ESCWE|nr:Lysine-specific demethylase 4 [Escovopsis weberi]
MDPDVTAMNVFAMSRHRPDRYELDPVFVNVDDCHDYEPVGISAFTEQVAPNGYQPQQPYPVVDLELESPVIIEDFPPFHLLLLLLLLLLRLLQQRCGGGGGGRAPDLHGAVIAGSPIKYELQALPGGHRLLLFKPTPAQWADFPSIFSMARRLGADAEGCFKMALPLEMRDPLPARAPQRFPAIAYKVRQIRARTFWQVSTVKSDGVFSSSQGAPADYPGTAEDAIKALKTIFTKNKDRRMRNVLYRPDIPAWTPKQRREAGVPSKSPIHPLAGDLLDHTKAIIPGIHTPYVYESAPHFGASFQLHAEDYRLTSLNHLYRGRKIWIVVPSTAVDVAEKALDRKNKCSQFMRHRAEFFFPDRFDKMGIPYRIVDQRPGETIVVLPDAYHQGFSTGYTLAEAKNYADSGWTDESYQPCEPRCKLATAIPGELMRRIGDGEERLNLCAEYEQATASADVVVVSSIDVSPAQSQPPAATSLSKKRQLEVGRDVLEDRVRKSVRVH